MPVDAVRNLYFNKLRFSFDYEEVLLNDERVIVTSVHSERFSEDRARGPLCGPAPHAHNYHLLGDDGERRNNQFAKGDSQ